MWGGRGVVLPPLEVCIFVWEHFSEEWVRSFQQALRGPGQGGAWKSCLCHRPASAPMLGTTQGGGSKVSACVSTVQ